MSNNFSLDPVIKLCFSLFIPTFMCMHSLCFDLVQTNSFSGHLCCKILIFSEQLPSKPLEIVYVTNVLEKVQGKKPSGITYISRI